MLELLEWMLALADPRKGAFAPSLAILGIGVSIVCFVTGQTLYGVFFLSAAVVTFVVIANIPSDVDEDSDESTKDRFWDHWDNQNS